MSVTSPQDWKSATLVDKMKVRCTLLVGRNDPFIVPSEGISKPIGILVVPAVQRLMIAAPGGVNC